MAGNRKAPEAESSGAHRVAAGLGYDPETVGAMNCAPRLSTSLPLSQFAGAWTIPAPTSAGSNPACSSS